MIQEIRLYKRYDTDLLALCDAGYSISLMIKDALYGYAHSIPVHIYIDKVVPFDLNKKTSVHTRFTIPDSDLQTCYLLRNIKHGYRNSFCKNILRNALVQQNLAAYFADNGLLRLQADNLQQNNLSALPNLRPCSSYTLGSKQESLFGDQYKKKKKPDEVSHMEYQSPYPMGAPAQVQQVPVYPQMAPIQVMYGQPAQQMSVPPAQPVSWGVQDVKNHNWTYPGKNDISVNEKEGSKIPVQPNLAVEKQANIFVEGSGRAQPQLINDPVTPTGDISSQGTPTPVPSVDNGADIDPEEGISLAGDDKLLNIFDNL